MPNARESKENYNTDQEGDQEGTQDQTNKKKWEFSEARQQSLVKARQKAKELREQLKMMNPPKVKERRLTKLEKELKEATSNVVDEPLTPKEERAKPPPPKEVEKEATPPLPKQQVEEKQVEEKQVEKPVEEKQVEKQVEKKLHIVRKGKLTYLVD